LRTPTIVLTSVGKKVISAHTSTLLVSPLPNQITNRGAIATMGTLWLATK
jgi:hypothetical protein